MTTALGRAVALAARIHEHQQDKGGKAYILHPIRLMMRLRSDDEELLCIAVLHDVVEDSEGGVTLESLRVAGFSPRVIAALKVLTHLDGESYDHYIRGIATNRDAAQVKLEDLRDNSDITRLKGLRPKDIERVEKYHKAFVYLRSVLDTMDRVGY